MTRTRQTHESSGQNQYRYDPQEAKAFFITYPHGHWNVQRSRRTTARLFQRQGKRPVIIIIRGRVLDRGRARGTVPPRELGQVDAVRIGHGGQKVVTSYCRSIVSLKVQIHTLSESIFTEQSLVHSNDLSSFVVNSTRVKVVHADVRLGSDGV